MTDYNKNGSIINSMFDKVELVEPFNIYYNNIKIRKIEKFTVYINTLHKLTKTYDILNELAYYKYNTLPSPKYSTQDIPVYMKPVYELENMITYNYYKRFNFEYINTYNFNPTLFSSEYLKNYNLIITPTITPHTKDLIVIVPSHTAYDFFIDGKTLLNEMYDVYLSLKKINTSKFLIYNFLETGSLPESYHFHIQKIELNKPKLKNISKGLYEIDNSEDKSWGNIYCFKIGEISWDTLCIILPILLYDCRLYTDLDKKYKFSAQIYIYSFDDTDYLFFSFKKNSVVNIRLNDENYLVDEYWQDLYGNSFKKYGMKYFPVGIIIYTLNEDKPLVVNDDVIKELHSTYHLHPNIKSIYKDTLKKLSNNKITKFVPYNYIKSCVKVNSSIGYSLYNNKNITNSKCNNLPFLYKDTENYFGKKTGTSLMYVNGNKFYVVNVNIEQKREIKKIVKLNLIFVFPFYYSKFTNNSNVYMCFQNVNTNLYKYLQFENNSVKKINYNFIHLCILVVAYNLTVLYERYKMVFYIESLEDLLVCEENRGLIDYNFDDYVVSVGKTLNDFKILHNGKNVLFKFKTLLNNVFSDSIVENVTIHDSFKNFIKLFNDQLNYFNVTNLLLISIKNIVDKEQNNFKINNIVKLFDFTINNFAYKPPNYQNYNIFKSLRCPNEYQNLRKCINDNIIVKNEPVPDCKIDDVNCIYDQERIKKYCDIFLKKHNDCTNNTDYDELVNTIKNSSFNFFDHFEKIVLPEDTFFVSGTYNIKNSPIEVFTENSHYFDKTVYFSSMDNLRYETYLYHLYHTYMKNSSFSRIVVYRSLGAEIYKLKKPVNTETGIIVSELDIDYLTHKTSDDFYNDYFEIVRQILFPNIKYDNFLLLLETYAKISKFDLIFQVFAQDLLNFCISIKYPLVTGYSNYNMHDDMVEYIIFKPKIVMEPFAVIKPTAFDIKIFYNISIVNNFFNNLRENYKIDHFLTNDYKINKNKKYQTINKELIKISTTHESELDFAIFLFYIYYGYKDIISIIKNINSLKYNLFTSPILDDLYYNVLYDDINNYYVNN